MPGKKPTSKALQPKWQGSNISADATKQTKPKIHIIGIGKHGKKTISQLTKTTTTNIQTTTITTKPHKTILNNLNKTDTIILVTNLAGNKEHKNISLITEKAKTRGNKIAGIVICSHEYTASKLTELKQLWDTTIIVNDKNLTDQLPQASPEEIEQLQQKASAKIIENMIEAASTYNEDNLDPASFKPLFQRGENSIVLQPTFDPRDIIHTSSNLLKDRGKIIEDIDQLADYVRQPLGREINKFTVTVVATEAKTDIPTVTLSTIAPQLLNLEPHSTSKQKLPIDLNLHQMENF